MLEKKPVSIFLNKWIQLKLFLTGSFGLMVLSIFFAVLFAVGANFYLEGEAYQSLLSSSQFLVAINFISYLTIMLIFLSWLTSKGMLKSFISLIKNGLVWQKSFFYFGMLYLSLLVLGLIYESLGIIIEDNNNQTTITQLTLSFPVLSILTFVFLGPIVEEITYRLGLYSFIKRYNRWLALVITALIFGFIHFDYSSSNYMNELMNMPLYILAGIIFTFIYEKEGFEVATLTHIINNGFSLFIIWVISWSTSSL